MADGDDPEGLRDTIDGLHAGDFSRLAPRFFGDAGAPPVIEAWIAAGALDAATLAEALTCASFNGALAVVDLLIACQVPPSGGSGTGLDALHWAANRGQLAAVRRLLAAGASIETRSMYGGTALGTAVWSAQHEPRADHPGVIEALVDAGATLETVTWPTGDDRIDAILARAKR